MNGYGVTRAAAGIAVALLCAAAPAARAADTAPAADHEWSRGSQWFSMRAGYAKGSGDFAPNGMVGYGFGYRRFVLDRWSIGAFVHHELLGRFGGAADIEVPMTVEIVRHTRWGAAFYPYAGVGAGAYYRKYYRTGQGFSGFDPGAYLTLGAHTPITKAGLLGLDIRLSRVDAPDENPVFSGPDASRLKVPDIVKKVPQPTPANTTDWIPYNDFGSKMGVSWSVKLEYTIAY